MEMTS